ncbi:uncharacterized protein PFL1_05122 [Pseudozyma flocculosa PF-1]|uniref:Uncharacterized protein n=1 Tax=Pseudozyma flocculosa PF-1 TaxID=1277687 RepID=A0A061H479_9BASI|nr:uncharacterized protein PFL1_05122 [Pseudozyma flocculosa PF-1]EPQ27199.1 hypothetical protein PFL1_05122 [Pseudozyma flocculosa PF-1]
MPTGTAGSQSQPACQTGQATWNPEPIGTFDGHEASRGPPLGGNEATSDADAEHEVVDDDDAIHLVPYPGQAGHDTSVDQPSEALQAVQQQTLVLSQQPSTPQRQPLVPLANLVGTPDQPRGLTRSRWEVALAAGLPRSRAAHRLVGTVVKRPAHGFHQERGTAVASFG